ncbi:hypothetical protein GCM10009544_31050 [Streptomyces stramineus]|uniref:Uncharacterized protein n=1 Tax=Streptomyces stramineus TaxID=173861 RepID=A0ABN1A3G3_9ACTN
MQIARGAPLSGRFRAVAPRGGPAVRAARRAAPKAPAGPRKSRAPHPPEGMRGPARDADSLREVDQTVSSSTRRLRVRLESSGMLGPIVVVMAAFLM